LLKQAAPLVKAQVSKGPSAQTQGARNQGSTKRAAQTVSLAPEGASVQTYPPGRTATGEERDESHQTIKPVDSYVRRTRPCI